MSLNTDSNVITLVTANIEGPEAKGIAKIVQIGHEIILKLEDYWIAPGAPDVRFYLSPDTMGSVDEAIEVGSVHQFSGNTEYQLPPSIQLNDFRSLVVYCKVYSVTFGVGVLQQVNQQG